MDDPARYWRSSRRISRELMVARLGGGADEVHELMEERRSLESQIAGRPPVADAQRRS